MKKNLFLILLALPFVLVACNDKNAPGKSENSSVPAITREILYANVSETQKILTDKGFVQSGDATSGIYVYYYPAEMISEDEKTYEAAMKNEWVSIDCHTEGGRYAQSIEGTHHLTSANNAFGIFKQWMSYLQKNITKPSLHYVMIVEGESVDIKEPFMFIEGTIGDQYKEFMLEQIEAVYKAGGMNPVEYAEARAAYLITKEDLDKKTASLSTNRQFSIVDVYCELTDATNYKGVLTTSFYENATEESDTTIPQNTVLNHVVVVGDVKDAIIDFIPPKL